MYEAMRGYVFYLQNDMIPLMYTIGRELYNRSGRYRLLAVP